MVHRLRMSRFISRFPDRYINTPHKFIIKPQLPKCFGPLCYLPSPPYTPNNKRGRGYDGPPFARIEHQVRHESDRIPCSSEEYCKQRRVFITTSLCRDCGLPQEVPYRCRRKKAACKRFCPTTTQYAWPLRLFIFAHSRS